MQTHEKQEIQKVGVFARLLQNGKKLAAKIPFIALMCQLAVVQNLAFASGGGIGGGGTGATADPDQTWNDLISFFATWIGRVGLVVAFVGAVMFALAIRNEDADAKSRGLMTMISGIVVFAVTLSLDLFGIT